MGQSASSRTYLKKIEPPNFSGDILDFPEFKRKWAANVTREKLEEESELDRLRDNVPETARKMLIGEKSLGNAWKILTKLYGNKTMLANKLKAKLKNIKVSGKEDHDVVINLAIEVKSIVKNLTEVNMEEMLKYDDEYLSAIFKALPNQERTKWLNFDKDSFSSEWKAMEAFMEDAHDKATSTKILLSNYAAQESSAVIIRCKKCHKIGPKNEDCTDFLNVKVDATRNQKNESDDDSCDTRQNENEKQRIRELCGKYRNTFKRRMDGQIWPSDHFSFCEKFRDK